MEIKVVKSSYKNDLNIYLSVQTKYPIDAAALEIKLEEFLKQIEQNYSK